MNMVVAQTELAPYGPILVLLCVATAMAAIALILGHWIGPKRKGSRKGETYESGMPPIGDARKRFNVRFYVVALLFLLFDVEIVFLWPWAPVFHRVATTDEPISFGLNLVADQWFLVFEAGLFVAILLIGLIYAWGKGVLNWE